MNIIVRDIDHIFSIKEKFNKHFPYLKLEFFYSTPVENKFTGSILKNDKTFTELRVLNKNEGISITGEMTVWELCKRFLEIYGLAVKIFRKSGTSWLETTVTDGWTLEEQNKQGQLLSQT